MLILRKLFYSNRGNQIVRHIVTPFKALVPERFHFPVSGKIRIAIPGFEPLVFHVNPTCYLGKVLFWDGILGFETSVHHVFKYLMERAGTFVDVGANIGFYSLLAFRYNPKATIVSFEPLPAGFKYLQANIDQNAAFTIEARQIALSDTSETTTFFYSLNPKFAFVKDQLTSTGSLDMQQANRTARLKDVRVAQTTLDKFVEEFNTGQIDLIKLDTEATEHLVLDGAVSTIQKHRPIILCEVLPGKVESEILSRIESFGYLAFKITDSGLIEVQDLRHDRSGTNDHLFCPPEKQSMIQDLMHGTSGMCSVG